MNNITQFTSTYSKGILKVEATTPNPTFSHLLNVNCKTVNHPNERAYILKKVNFYSFRKYMEQTNGNGFNWYDWYMTNRANAETFNAAIAGYINHIENRTAVYVSKDGSKLDRLIYSAIETAKGIDKLIVLQQS